MWVREDLVWAHNRKQLKGLQLGLRCRQTGCSRHSALGPAHLRKAPLHAPEPLL